MILVSGFNVYPNEVEEVAAMHPGVLECAAVGIPEPEFRRGGETVCGEEGPEPERWRISRPIGAANLTNYKRPRVIEFRDLLPKSNVGKILRRELR